MKQLTALNQVMIDIEQHYPNLFDLNTAQGREFVSRFHKYLEVEKEQISGAYLQAKMENLNMPDSMKYYDILEQNKIKAEEHYAKTFSNTGS